MKEFGDVLKNVSLKDYSTIGIGGKCDYLIKPHNEKELIGLLKYLKDNNLKYYILGNCSNVLIDEHHFHGVIIKLDYFNDIKLENNKLVVGAGVMLPKLVSLMLSQNVVNLTFLSMIPGTVGASIVGNAGCFGDEIMNHVNCLKVIDNNGCIKTLEKKDIDYGYRYTSLKNNYIILEAEFDIKKGDSIKALTGMQEKNEKRILTQPLNQKSVGSIFKNPEGSSAGKLIDELGLKGYQIGGAKISQKHGNFIVNDNNASFNDVIKLINFVKQKVKEKYNIELELEPTIIKWDEL